MSLARALGVAAADLYHQSWRLVILNGLLGAFLVGVVLASLAVRQAVLLFVLLGPVAAAVMHCAVMLAQTEELRMSEALVGLRRHWRRGLALGALVAAAASLGAVAVPFYSRMGTWAWPLAMLSIYVLLVFALFQLALWPLAVFEVGRPLREVLRDAVPLQLSNTSSTCCGTFVKPVISFALISSSFRPDGLTFAPAVSSWFRPNGLTFAPLISFALMRPPPCLKPALLPSSPARPA